MNTEHIIRHCLQEGVKITLVVNKIDRLILELRVKPADAYYKIKHTIEEVNTIIRFARCNFHVDGRLTEPAIVVSTQTLHCVLAPNTEMLRSRARTCTGALHCGPSPRCTQIHTVRILIPCPNLKG